MTSLGIRLGSAMIALGVLAYLLSGAASVTALIPAFIGLIIVALGLLAQRNPKASRVAHYGMLALAVLAVLGSLRVFGMLSDGIGIAEISQLLMIALGLALLVPGIKLLRNAGQKHKA